MHLHRPITAVVVHAAWLLVPCAFGENAGLLDKLRGYEQGGPPANLIDTRQAVFHGTGDEAVRAERERGLLAFIASDAHPQAKAIAIDWLGCLGTAASVPALVAARENPALAAPAAAALERIPGPEAEKARAARPANRLVVSAAAAGVGDFHDSLGKGNDDALLTAALCSPNDLLAGAATRLVRAGAGSPELMKKLPAALDQMPASRQAPLCEALATRPEAAGALRPVLIARVRSGDPEQRAAALLALGRILCPDDLPMVLDLAADSENPALCAAAKSALVRATNPEINPALIHDVTTGDARALPAIEALAARHTVEAADHLWNASSSNNATVSSAAFKALGAILPPAQLPAALDRLAAAQGSPAADGIGKLVWDVIRRHPEPAAAADLLDQRAAKAPGDMKQVLLRHAARIRPKDIPTQSRLELPADDDSAVLAPDFHERLVYLNCGFFNEARNGGIAIRRVAGEAYQFGVTGHPLATVDHGDEIRYEITGLENGVDYVLAISAWDADQKGRRQSLFVNGRELLPDFAPTGYHADQPTHIRAHLPLARDLTAGGKATVAIRKLAGPNAVVSEIRLLRRKADAPTVKRVVILTGDDFPAHHWRVTGPEFAAILRADPRLEVTVTESPALLGSPALMAYDAVFLHFKNYHKRLPTSGKLWSNLESYIHGGGGLVIAHFGCGAMQEWNRFVKVAGRIWDPEKRGHDPYGGFLVRILQTGHPATMDMGDFTTNDELYTCLAGDAEIQVLAEATSNVDQKDYPMAFVRTPGKGRVFNSPLGHDLRALQSAGARKLFLQGTLWAAGAVE
jgi:uncharacterized protein